MTFFEQQDAARKRTWLLVIYFLLALIGIIGTIHLTISILLSMVSSPEALSRQVVMTAGEANMLAIRHFFLDGELAGTVAGVTLSIILIGSLYKVFRLAEGGDTIAIMLGGRRVFPDTQDARERRVLNVVEETAIASGMSVPPVYLMEHEGAINAFAAGFSPRDAVIGVSKGCLDYLTRDELQGVIAHEFSHILNGDMRLNIRLMGLLHGILVIALLGYFLLRRSFYVRSGSRNNRGGPALQIIVLGAALWAIGYVGVFFGKLIKAAVSRQREFLADASAVQFTRNPKGIAGALAKIGGMKLGSLLQTPNAEEASHLFFANGLSASFLSLLSTHPPLEERIRRIDPAFSGEFPEVTQRTSVGDTAQDSVVSRLSSGSSGGGVSPEGVGETIGQPQGEHLSYAAGLLSSLSPKLASAVREPYGAQAVVYALLLDNAEHVREAQLIRLAKLTDGNIYREVLVFWRHIRELGDAARLPLLDLCLPSLTNLSLRQYQTLEGNVQQLVEADNDCSLFEFVLQVVLRRHLEPLFRGRANTPLRYRTLRPIIGECQRLLSLLAREGHRDSPEFALQAFEQALAELHPKLPGRLRLLPEVRASELDEIVGELALAAPALKKRIIKACVASVVADEMVALEESELIRGICDALDCPLPPFLPGVSALG